MFLPCAWHSVEGKGSAVSGGRDREPRQRLPLRTVNHAEGGTNVDSRKSAGVAVMDHTRVPRNELGAVLADTPVNGHVLIRQALRLSLNERGKRRHWKLCRNSCIDKVHDPPRGLGKMRAARVVRRPNPRALEPVSVVPSSGSRQWVALHQGVPSPPAWPPKSRRCSECRQGPHLAALQRAPVLCGPVPCRDCHSKRPSSANRRRAAHNHATNRVEDLLHGLALDGAKLGRQRRLIDEVDATVLPVHAARPTRAPCLKLAGHPKLSKWQATAVQCLFPASGLSVRRRTWGCRQWRTSGGRRRA